MAHKQNLWWGPPRNFDERQNERKVSWLELFYDLVYVAAISRLTHHLAEHLTWHQLAYSSLFFALIFWSWVNGSQYYDLHGSDSIRTRIFTFLQMLAVAAVAITIDDVFKGQHQSFVIAFTVIQVLITYLWFSVGYYDPSHRVYNIYYTFNYVLAILLLIVSYFTGYETAIIIFSIVLVLNLTPGLTGWRTFIRVSRQRGQEFSASATIVERFGLFTIIVLAESILGTVTGIAEVKDRYPLAWIAFIISILVAFLLWSIYFDMTSEQETKPGYANLQLLIFLHYPLLAALGVVGACLKILLSDMDVSSHRNLLWIFCCAIATILLMIIAIAAIMKEEEEDRAYIRPVSRLLLLTTVLVLVVPLFGKYLNAISFLSVIAIILLVPVFVGVRSWVQYKFFGRN